MKYLKNTMKYSILWFIGGDVYYKIEVIARGYSHISMFILGAFCFLTLGLINEFFSVKISLIKQMTLGAIIITLLEFITGCIVNLWLGLNIWDYSAIPLNILGQICLPFTIIWFFLSAVGIFLYNWTKYLFFGEEKPYYKIF